MKSMHSSFQIAALAAAVLCAAATTSTAQAQTATHHRRAPATPPAPVPPPDIAAPTPPPPPPLAESGHHNFNFDAFIDPNARITSRNYLFAPGDLARGFFLKDAALSLTADLSHQTHAVIDLPFYTDPNSTSNAFAFAQGYAQAYIAYTLSGAPVTFKLGQYNSFFGLESNSSRDRFFTQESLTKKFVDPWTHTGAQAAWASQGATKFSALVQVANSNVSTSGTSSVAPLGDNNVEVGLQGRVDAGMGYGALGFSLSKGQNYPMNIDTGDSNMLVELMGGLNFGSFNLGLQLDSKKTNGFSDSAFTAELLGAYQITADLAAGLRLEDLSNAPAYSLDGKTAIEIKSGMGIAVGPSYKLDSNLAVRGDLNYNTLKSDALNNGSARGYFGVNLSAVASM